MIDVRCESEERAKWAMKERKDIPIKQESGTCQSPVARGS